MHCQELAERFSGLKNVFRRHAAELAHRPLKSNYLLPATKIVAVFPTILSHLLKVGVKMLEKRVEKYTPRNSNSGANICSPFKYAGNMMSKE